MVLCMVLHMVLGNDGFQPLVFFVDPVKGTTVMFYSRVYGLGFMYASACIYMCCNTKRNIMKNQVGCPDLGSRGKSLCLSILCFMLSLLFIFFYKIRV